MRFGKNSWLAERVKNKLPSSKRKGLDIGETIARFQYSISILGEFLLSSAEKVLCKRANLYALGYGFLYDKLYVEDVKNRWGSYTLKGDLGFNWRFTMVPLEIVDYVVVHKLSHLFISNHRKEFLEKLRKEYQITSIGEDGSKKMGINCISFRITRKKNHPLPT